MPHVTEDPPESLGSTNGTLDLKATKKTDHESSERDPCLDLKHPDQKDAKFYEKYVQMAQDKTGLDRKWVWIVFGLAFSVVLLVLIVLGLICAWPYVPHMYDYPICRDPECLRAAAQIQEDLNSSVSPCTNLWGAFCSTWSKNSTRPLDRAIWSQKERLVVKESERIRDLIATLKLPVSTGSIEWKMKFFYESCLDVGTFYSNEAPLVSMITELGGWYVTGNWNIEEFNGVEVITKLQVHYGVSPFFKVHVEPDPHSPDSYSIRLSPSGLGLPDKEYYYRDRDDPIRVAYIKYIRDVVIHLSTTKTEASKFAEDMFSYEKRLAEITPDRASLRHPITTYNAFTLSELKDNMVPFYDILQNMYLKANITENTEVIVTSLDYLAAMSQIISTTDQRTMNGYLIWTLVRNYFPYLANRYTSTLDSFHSELFGTSAPLKRWEFCAGLIKTHMGLATEYLLENSSPIKNITKENVNTIFSDISKVLKQKLKKFQNSPLLHQHLENKLKTVSIQVGLPDDVKSLKFVKNYYTPLTIIKLNFFESVKNAMLFKKAIEERMLVKSLVMGGFLKEYLKETPQVQYLASKNQVIVPRSLLTEPYYEDGFPIAIVYGRLGLEIAQAMTSAILPYDSLWTADRKILSPFHMTVNESFKSVEKAATCLSRYILDINLDIPVIIANETALSIVTELTAVTVAKEALAKRLTRILHSHQGGLEIFEDEALFFVSYTQTRCSESTSQYQYYENVIDFRLSFKALLHVVWSQLSDFQETFECRPNRKLECNRVL